MVVRFPDIRSNKDASMGSNFVLMIRIFSACPKEVSHNNSATRNAGHDGDKPDQLSEVRSPLLGGLPAGPREESKPLCHATLLG